MFIVGLDLSNLYPGLCISDNFETFEFISIVNDRNMSYVNKTFLLELETSCHDFTIKFLEPHEKKTKEYFELERVKLLNSIGLETAINAEIIKNVNSHDA